jgi:hypothetical protein
MKIIIDLSDEARPLRPELSFALGAAASLISRGADHQPPSRSRSGWRTGAHCWWFLVATYEAVAPADPPTGEGR